MSFRQFGGMNYAPKHNIVGSHYNTSTNLQVTEAVGQPNSYINFESDISGNATFYGDFNLNGNLNVSGNISSGGDTNVNGDLNVTGATTLSNTLDVAGATTLSNTLNVSGQTEITNQLTVYNTSTPNSYKGAFLNSDGNPLTIGEGILLSANGSVTEIKMNNAGLSNFTINNNGSFNIVDTSNNSSPFTAGNNLLSISSNGDTDIYGNLDVSGNITANNLYLYQNILGISTTTENTMIYNSTANHDFMVGSSRLGRFSGTTLDVSGNVSATYFNVKMGDGITPQPTYGITNNWNTGGFISFAGQGGKEISYQDPLGSAIQTEVVANKGVRFDFFVNPSANCSLFEVNFTRWNTSGFEGGQWGQVYCFLQLYPNRLFTLSPGAWEWKIDNNINNDADYDYTNPTLAPNGRWYWTYNQQITNKYANDGSAWLMPTEEYVELYFNLMNLDDYYEFHVRCLDATALTNEGASCQLNLFETQQR